jgi:hypothetical protein
MPLLPGGQDAFLDNNYGPNKGASAPTSHDYALFTDDPTDAGVEVTGTGYARVTVANDSGWPDSVDGSKQRDVTWPSPTGDWTGAACWVEYVGTTQTAYAFLDDTYALSDGDDPLTVTVIQYIPNADNVGS